MLRCILRQEFLKRYCGVELLNPNIRKFNLVREEVRRSMVEAQCSVQLTFPVELKGPDVVSVHFLQCTSVILYLG